MHSTRAYQMFVITVVPFGMKYPLWTSSCVRRCGTPPKTDWYEYHCQLNDHAHRVGQWAAIAKLPR